MIKVENLPKAYKEVYVIMEHIHKSEKSKVPDEFINMVKNNMQEDYDFQLTSNSDFENKDILQETKVILAYIFLNYWASNELKNKIDIKFRQDIALEEAQKSAYYNKKEIFKKNNNIETTSSQMIEYSNISLWKRIMYKIKRIIRYKD